MYRFFDFEAPRLFVAGIRELEKGAIDPALQPGFECYFGRELDLGSVDVQAVIGMLEQRKCAYLACDSECGRYLGETPFETEFLVGSPLPLIEDKVLNGLERDLLFVYEDVGFLFGVRDERAELYENVCWDRLPKYDSEVVEQSTTALATPFGDVTVVGPDGLVPFKVVKLLNRAMPDGRAQTVRFVNNLFKITIELDSLTDHAEYYVGCKGRAFSYCYGDERTTCFTCSADGFVFGIGVYDPSDDWDCYPGYDPSRFEGYFVDLSFGEASETPVCVIPVPLCRDRVKEATLWVGWLEDWDVFDRYLDCSAEDVLGYFLT